MKKLAPVIGLLQVALLAIGFAVLMSSGSGDESMQPSPPNARPGPTVVSVVVASDGLRARLRQATRLARDRGADLTVAALDRVSGLRVSNGNDTPIETASVSKLFIADDLLFREYEGALTLSDNDRALIDIMLRSSDDAAAQALWARFGRAAMISRVSSRYRLGSTSTPPGAPWWRTQTTMADVVTYYAALLDGSGGLPADRSSTILGDITDFTTTGTDGYYQRFGLPDALSNEPEIGVKQGWMCCIEGNWIHLTTGFAGAGRRYVVAMGSREHARYGGGSLGAEHARQTLSEAAEALFPDGRIEL